MKSFQNHQKSRGQRKKFRPPAAAADMTERNRAWHRYLLPQADAVSAKIAGMTAMVVLAGNECRHDPDGLRPLHKDMQWSTRPTYVCLSATKDTLTLTTSTSKADGGFLRYMNGNGTKPASWDFGQTPYKGAVGPVLDGFVQHALFTCGNQLLQTMIDAADEPPQEFTLPKLLIRTNRVTIDEAKLEAAVAKISPALRTPNYIRDKRDSVGVTYGGVLFGDADLMPDAEVKDGIVEKRAYEDYAALLGGTVPNPARKVLFPANPAKEVLHTLQLPVDWAATAAEAEDRGEGLAERLIKEMRRRLPLPEMATDSDILTALERPNDRITFSIPIEKVATAAKVRAMRATFPERSKLREVVKDVELVDAIHDPFLPLRVSVYSRIQRFRTADMVLPSYATGNFFAWQQATELPLA